MISIHAPREGSDLVDTSSGSCFGNFYPRSPRGERLWGKPLSSLGETFLSTLPARGATAMPLNTVCTTLFLSTLPARGATGTEALYGSLVFISIHAPREGSDIRAVDLPRPI